MAPKNPVFLTPSARSCNIRARAEQWLTTDERATNSQKFAEELTLERVLAAEKKVDESLPTLEEFKEHHDRVVSAPGSSVRDFAKILQATDSKIIVVQLNIDCLVERNTKARLKIFASADEFEGASAYVQRYRAGQESEIPLLKLHGTIERTETCIVTQDQTDSGVCDAQFQTLVTLLEITEERLPWVYVGVSMRDRDLLQVLRGQQFAKQLDERWVNPYVVPSLRKLGEDRMPHWKETNHKALEDRVITETSDAFFDALRTAWIEEPSS